MLLAYLTERVRWQVGKMDVNVSKAMAAEHTMSQDSEEAFVAPNTGLSTTPFKEWLFVVGTGGCVSEAGEIVEGERRENEVLAEGRNAKSLEHLKGLIEARESELTMVELVALRLYTGPMVSTTPLHCIVDSGEGAGGWIGQWFGKGVECVAFVGILFRVLFFWTDGSWRACGLA
jgi:hypothetical protein